MDYKPLWLPVSTAAPFEEEVGLRHEEQIPWLFLRLGKLCWFDADCTIKLCQSPQLGQCSLLTPSRAAASFFFSVLKSYQWAKQCLLV